VRPVAQARVGTGLAAVPRVRTLPAVSARPLLVVDDDDDVRDSLALVLRDEGYAVETAANGKEALEKLDHMPAASVVLLDLMMPVMNGWKTLEQLRARNFETPVIVISAAVPPAPAHATGYLRKPVDIDLLLQKVSDLVN
jgi:CheY-like chemotaxis protein